MPSAWGLVVLLMPWVVTGTQRWEEEPRSLAVNPGEEVVLACKVVNMGGDCRCKKLQYKIKKKNFEL